MDHNNMCDQITSHQITLMSWCQHVLAKSYTLPSLYIFNANMAVQQPFVTVQSAVPLPNIFRITLKKKKKPDRFTRIDHLHQLPACL